MFWLISEVQLCLTDLGTHDMLHKNLKLNLAYSQSSKFFRNVLVFLTLSALHSCLINGETNTAFLILKLIPNALTIDQDWTITPKTIHNSEMEGIGQGGFDLSCLWTMNHTWRGLSKFKQPIAHRALSVQPLISTNLISAQRLPVYSSSVIKTCVKDQL